MTYTASASLSAHLHGPIPIRKTLTGTAYYRKPVRKIVFDNVPAPLRRFSELASTMPTYAQVSHDYAVTPQADDGTTSSYALFPTKQDGRVRELDVQVSDSSHLLEEIVWKYKTGESLSFTATYESSGPFELLSSVTIAAHYTAYNVDGTLRFSNYKLGVAVTL